MVYSLVRSLIPLLLHTMLRLRVLPLMFRAPRAVAPPGLYKLGHDISYNSVACRGTRCRLSVHGIHKNAYSSYRGGKLYIEHTLYRRRAYIDDTVWPIPGVPVEFPVTTRRDNPQHNTTSQLHNTRKSASVPSRNVTQLSVCDDDSRRGGLRGGRGVGPRRRTGGAHGGAVCRERAAAGAS
jgi:hypothetical protein